MITYESACKIADSVRSEMCPSYKYTEVFDIHDRWAFIFTIYPLDSEEYMIAPPSFYIYKEDGRFEWFSVPPLENLDILETGKEIDFLCDV